MGNKKQDKRSDTLKVSLNGNLVLINIIRERRKSEYIRLGRDGTFIMRFPREAGEDEIRSFLKRNEGWINEVLEARRKYEEARAKTNFTDGEMHLLFGRYYHIRIVNSGECLHFDESFLLRYDCKEDYGILFRDFYTKALKDYLDRRLNILSKEYNFHYTSYRVGKAIKRWGSCSHDDRLTFSWLLGMAPPECIDYVIIHELVHTRIKSHGKVFWSEVEKILPDWRLRRDWLIQNHSIMISVSPQE
ncbi:M48 family metallopeptidase [Cuniculiplasma sp. SKW4]|uniref:M48 family metallopeptidase n=1 Tax=Cuniculiplasma sp. SKW4 TaxID=3400171 RepID=UPI003FD0BE4F